MSNQIKTPRYELPPRLNKSKNDSLFNLLLQAFIALGLTTATIGFIIWLNIIIYKAIF